MAHRQINRSDEPARRPAPIPALTAISLSTMLLWFASMDIVEALAAPTIEQPTKTLIKPNTEIVV